MGETIGSCSIVSIQTDSWEVHKEQLKDWMMEQLKDGMMEQLKDGMMEQLKDGMMEQL
jgi:hypothetical protein